MEIYIFWAPWIFLVSRARPRPSGNKVNAEPPYTQAKPYGLTEFPEEVSRAQQGVRKAGGVDAKRAGLGLRKEEIRLHTPTRVMAARELAPTATPGRGRIDETRLAF